MVVVEVSFECSGSANNNLIFVTISLPLLHCARNESASTRLILRNSSSRGEIPPNCFVILVPNYSRR